MATLTISIPEDRLAQLEKIAARFSLQPEDLLRVSLEDLLARPEADFKRALDYVMDKNAELYRRLA